MARCVLLFVLLLTWTGVLSLGATARAQAPASPPAAPPIHAPPIYLAPYPPPVYAPAPYPMMAPYDNQLYDRRGRYRPPYRTLAWRALLEFGGTLEGRVVTSVDGRVIRSKDAERVVVRAQDKVWLTYNSGYDGVTQQRCGAIWISAEGGLDLVLAWDATPEWEGDDDTTPYSVIVEGPKDALVLHVPDGLVQLPPPGAKLLWVPAK